MRLNILGYYLWSLSILISSHISYASSHEFTSRVFDIIHESLSENHQNQNETDGNEYSLAFVLQLIRCTFREVTLPSVKAIRREGPYSFGRKLITDVFISIAKRFELLPSSYLVRSEDEEFTVIDRRFKLCLFLNDERSDFSILKNSTKDDHEMVKHRGRDYGGGGHHGGYGGGGGHKGGSSIGFALLGLKIVGALIAFLIYKLLNQTTG